MNGEHAQLTQEILIHSATWWMGADEKEAFLIQVILAMAVSAAGQLERTAE